MGGWRHGLLKSLNGVLQTTQMHCCLAVSLAPFIFVLKMFNSYETSTDGRVGMVHKTADIVSGNNKGHMGVFLVEGGKEQCLIKTSVGRDLRD